MTPSTTPVVDTDTRAVYAGEKRRIATLEQQIYDFKNAGAAKHKSNPASGITQGRVICRLVSMFQSVDELVDEADRRRGLEAQGRLNDFHHSPDQQRTFHEYKLLAQHVPSLGEKLIHLDVEELALYFRELRKGSAGARGDDAANLKPAIVGWLVELMENSDDAPLSPTSKEGRGFEHELTGRLLCPIDYDWDDQSVRQSIREGHPDFVVSADLWPAFLYPHAKANEDDVEAGMFQSAILVKAFKFLFTSPTSAQEINQEDDLQNQIPRTKKRRNNKAPTRGNIADILQMKMVSPRAIAYVVVQLRFALSSLSSWKTKDGCFDYPTFYTNIVDFFENPPGPLSRSRAQVLLSWWTSKIFGNHQATDRPQSQAGSSVAKLARQRAMREGINSDQGIV